MINILKKIKIKIKKNLKIKKKIQDLYPLVKIEESFKLERKLGNVIFKIYFEVPSPIPSDNSDKKELEDGIKQTEAFFGPIVVVLGHYLRGICTENSPERMVIGRDNLINAIKECAKAQLKYIKEDEKNR